MTEACTIRLLSPEDQIPDTVQVWLSFAPSGSFHIYNCENWRDPRDVLIRAAHEGLADRTRPMIVAQGDEQSRLFCFLEYSHISQTLRQWVQGWNAKQLGFYVSPEISESPEKWLQQILKASQGVTSELFLLRGNHKPLELINWVRRVTSDSEWVQFEH